MTFCAAPFTTLHVLHRHYTPCCGAWLDKSVQVIRPRVDDPVAAWNSPEFARLRAAILDDDWRFCRYCPRMLNGQLDDTREPWHQPGVDRPPQIINLGNDRTCNLHCWSCRPQPSAEKPDPYRRRIVDRVVSELLPEAARLSVSHSGDPFASPIYRPMLQGMRAAEYPDLQIHLFTNALLLPRYWDSLAGIHDRIKAISVSIDAATRQTYERLRRGGRWDDLTDALEFLAGLRRAGVLDWLAGRFVVQATNFRKMPAFVRMMESYEVDGVYFAMLRRWPHLSRSEFDAVDLTRPDHPDAVEYRRILDDPALGLPIVKAGVFDPALYKALREYEGRTE